MAYQVEQETTLTVRGLVNGVVLGLLCWAVILGGLYLAWCEVAQ